MIKLVLLSALCAVAMGNHTQLVGHGYQHHGHGGYGDQYLGHGHGGYGNQHHGHGHGGYGNQHHRHGHGGYGNQHLGHGHGGNGWNRPYHGWADVNVWQTPHNYQYKLKENGEGYNKYVWQGADYQQTHPVKYATHAQHGWNQGWRS